jgi:hypothetical protein
LFSPSPVSYSMGNNSMNERVDIYSVSASKAQHFLMVQYDDTDELYVPLNVKVSICEIARSRVQGPGVIDSTWKQISSRSLLQRHHPTNTHHSLHISLAPQINTGKFSCLLRLFLLRYLWCKGQSLRSYTLSSLREAPRNSVKNKLSSGLFVYCNKQINPLLQLSTSF